MLIKLRHKKPIKPLPFPIYWGILFILAVTGLLNSIYLTKIHYYNYTDIGYKSFCAISKAINCDTVSQSLYSVVLRLPVAVWGIIGYFIYLVLLGYAWSRASDKKRVWHLLLLITLIFCSCSLVLAHISIFYIHSYCIMCLLSYGINFMLLFYTWITKRRFNKDRILNGIKKDFIYFYEKKRQMIAWGSLLLVIIVSTYILLPQYWKLTLPALSTDVSRGTTDEGLPWIGAENPELIITEFTDYQCFQCKKMHSILRQLVSLHPDKIRLIHCHYPMDHEFNSLIVKDPYHVGSGKLALFAIYSAAKGKFWEMNDLLFDISMEKEIISSKEISQIVGLDEKELANSIYSHEIRSLLQRDIWKGNKLRITGTPSYVIKGKVYLGQIPQEILNEVLE